MTSTSPPTSQTPSQSAPDAGAIKEMARPAVRAVQSALVLFDVYENGKIMVEGAEAASMLNQMWPTLSGGDAPSAWAIGSGIEVGSCQIYRLRSDLFLVHTPLANEAELLDRLSTYAQARAGLITVTSVTHGRAELRLVSGEATHPVEGAESRCRTLLNRVCGLDFSPAAFPNLTARATSLAKTRQLVIRRDQDGHLAYTIIGPRSLGAYVLATLAEAGRDLGIVLGRTE